MSVKHSLPLYTSLVYPVSCPKEVGISSRLPLNLLVNKVVEDGWRIPHTFKITEISQLDQCLALLFWLFDAFALLKPFWLPFWICFVCHAYFGSYRACLCSSVAPSHHLAYMLKLAQETGFPQPLASVHIACFDCVKSCVFPFFSKFPFTDLTGSVAPCGLFLILFSFQQMLWVRANLP